MEESSYKHNYEYLSIEEAKAIVNGTFVQGTTNIGGELATKADIDKLLTAADKKLTSIIPVTDTSNEFICFFECISNETFPDDLEHRWIEVSPRQFTFPANGGSVNITGSYGLTGTLGTRKKIGDIADTITADANATPSTKSGSKTYYYNNDQSQTPTAEVSWTQPNKDEEFPDDEAHRWIEITPTDAGNFTEAGGTITVTGSYGLTGSYGTKKTVGHINDTITVERNTTTQTKSGSKTYYYNNTPGTDPSATVTWTQDAHIESFTYEYHIYIGSNADAIQQKSMQLVWQSDWFGQSSKKSVFVNAYKSKINEQNQVVSTEPVEYGIKDSALTNQFTITENRTGLIYCYPLKQNLSYFDSNFGSFIVYIKGSEDIACKINLIQQRNGVQIIPGDAIMFTYNWDDGKDLDQATFVNLNLKNDNDKNYAGYYGDIIREYKNILYFAGDNTGKGNEYAFIDFKNISKYLNEHRDDQSSIAGKTILQSLTDQNGITSIQCDLYTNWYNLKESENITLSYSVYDKDSEDATVTSSNKQFILTGYSKIKDHSDQALCHASGPQNVIWGLSVKNGYTLSAKFTYYLNSGVFAFETNNGNVNKWNKGASLSSEKCYPSYSSVQFTNDGNNINFSVSIDSLNQPDYFDKNSIIEIMPYIQQKEVITNYVLIKKYKISINQLPYKIESSIPLSEVIEKIKFDESNTIEIIPGLSLGPKAISYSEEKYMTIDEARFNQNVLTIHKQNT